MPIFDNIYNLDCVPIATVQLRFDGWVTEMQANREAWLGPPSTLLIVKLMISIATPTHLTWLTTHPSPLTHPSLIFPFVTPPPPMRLQDMDAMMNVDGDQSDGRAAGIDNLLYSADAEFSCFADLALVSPGEYYKKGEGSLMQAVFDSRAFERSEEQIVADAIKQMNDLFPSSKKLKCTWSSVVKLGQSLYREKPGQDKYRPTQASKPCISTSTLNLRLTSTLISNPDPTPRLDSAIFCPGHDRRLRLETSSLRAATPIRTTLTRWRYCIHPSMRTLSLPLPLS